MSLRIKFLTAWRRSIQKLTTSSYPDRELTGVGVAFKLAHAVANRLIAQRKVKQQDVDLKNYLDLVALGTISDMGALRGENRILVRYGLEQLKKTGRVGLVKLFEVCELPLKSFNTSDIASKIAPRLNSLGRIADPRLGVELLLVREEGPAERLAKELDLFNIERQKIERVMSDEVEKFLVDHPEVFNEKAIALSSENWHPGVIAIVTTRLAKTYNRPAITIAIEEDTGKGSMRSIPEFPLLPILKENADLLLNFGGHNYAAGLTIAKENIAEFKKRFVTSANQLLKDNDVTSKLYLDAEVNFREINFDFMESLRLLEPYGNENPPPVLFCDVRQVWPPKVIAKSHLKFYLEQDERLLEGIAFGMANRKGEIRKKNMPLRVACTPQINNFHNKTSIQLLIRDFKAS